MHSFATIIFGFILGGILINMLSVMSAGEKRSVTLSMKKAFDVMIEEKSLSTFSTKQAFLKEYVDFWLNYSLTNRVAWCYDKKTGEKDHHRNESFQQEMEDKALEVFKAELSVLSDTIVEEKMVVAEIKESAPVSKNPVAPSPKKSEVTEEKVKGLKPLRSKKKRLQKKREKQMRLAA